MPNTPALQSIAFSVEAGELTRHSSGSRTTLRYAAPATRHLDGGFDCDVAVVLFDAQGRFVHRRGGDRSKTVLANRASWLHDIDNDCLASATRLVYEISHRFDYRRKIVAGELPELPAAADGSDYYRWLDLDPRTLEDRAVKLDLALWARNSSVELTISQQPKIETDSCRTDWELDLLDADHKVAFMRAGSVSLNYGRPSYDDSGISMDRRSMRMLKSFELRGRTEIRAIAQLEIDALP